eukprot:gene51475-62950_t
MNQYGIRSSTASLQNSGVNNFNTAYWNLSPAELVEHSLKKGEGVLTDMGALMCDTGKFTGRAPDDKFFVKDATTENTIWWGKVNQPVSPEVFDNLHDPAYRTNIR